jgi:putative colanic acid biosynthesis glycosyltransferase
MTELVSTQVSIVSIVKNHADGLQKTVSSILSQDYQNWQLLIIVGASSDTTLSTAKAFSLIDSRIRVYEEHGIGIYPAMNQGLGLAAAPFICFMNAGDQFANSTVLNELHREMLHSNVGVLIGGHLVEGKTGAYLHDRRKITEWSFAFNRKSGCHQAMLFRTNVLLEVGGFNLEYSLASDFCAVLAVLKNSQGLWIPKIVAQIEPGGAADKGIQLVLREKHQIRKIHFENCFIDVLSYSWSLAARAKIAFNRIIQN